jgi:hypothetical protein
LADSTYKIYEADAEKPISYQCNAQNKIIKSPGRGGLFIARDVILKVRNPGGVTCEFETFRCLQVTPPGFCYYVFLFFYKQVAPLGL